MTRHHDTGASFALALLVAATSGILLFYLYPATVDNAESTPSHGYLTGTPALLLYGLPTLLFIAVFVALLHQKKGGSSGRQIGR